MKTMIKCLMDLINYLKKQKVSLILIIDIKERINNLENKLKQLQEENNNLKTNIDALEMTWKIFT